MLNSGTHSFMSHVTGTTLEHTPFIPHFCIWTESVDTVKLSRYLCLLFIKLYTTIDNFVCCITILNALQMLIGINT